VTNGELTTVYNTVARIIIVALFVILVASPAMSGTQTIHLQPEEGVFGFTMFNPYYEAICERLLPSSLNRKCQAVFLPSFSQESAVYIVCDNNNSMATAVVVTVKLETQLWAEMHKVIEGGADAKGRYAIDAQAQRKALLQIRSVVNRFEAPLDATVAVALEHTWDAMLMRVHYPEESELGLDGETYHFSNFVTGSGFLTGKVWSPVKGTPSYELVELAKTLSEYPTLREADRKDAAQEMLKGARKLLARLGGSE
jgi:hypothetical protein